MPAIEVLPPAVPTDGVADVLAQTAGGVVSDAHTSDNVVEADRVPAAPLEGARSDDPGSLPERAASDERPRAKPRRPRGNNSSVRNVAVTAAVKYADDGPDNQLPPMSFLAEVAALDEEIEQLRRQLAEKLLLQNAQLVKLLERY